MALNSRPLHATERLQRQIGGIGHLLETASPDAYDAPYKRWDLIDLPIQYSRRTSAVSVTR